jgi:hypothetical protein
MELKTKIFSPQSLERIGSSVESAASEQKFSVRE